MTVTVSKKDIEGVTKELLSQTRTSISSNSLKLTVYIISEASRDSSLFVIGDNSYQLYKEVALLTNKRLSLKAYNSKLISKKKHEELNRQAAEVVRLVELCNTTINKEDANAVLKDLNEPTIKQSTKLKEIIKRPNISLSMFIPKKIKKPKVKPPYVDETVLEADTEIKYRGYVKRINKQTDSIIKNENMTIKSSIEYSKITGLSSEAQEKLQNIKPENMGQAMRISGVSVSDLAILSIYINKSIRVSRETQ